MPRSELRARTPRTDLPAALPWQVDTLALDDAPFRLRRAAGARTGSVRQPLVRPPRIRLVVVGSSEGRIVFGLRLEVVLDVVPLIPSMDRFRLDRLRRFSRPRH